MKVTISFDETKIVVPCGDGDITVRELTNLAVTRYKKAIGKPNNFWVSVSNLKSSFEGGMLDPDDLICDVCDDREQLIALFEEQPRSGLHGDHLGDGMSSEDSSDSKENHATSNGLITSGYDNNNALVNQGRRGSEPNLAKRVNAEKSNNNNNNPTAPAVTVGTVQAVVANFNAITQTKNTKPHLNDCATYGSIGRSFSAHHMMNKQLSPTQTDFFIRPSPTRNSTDHGRSSLRMTMLPGGGNRSDDYLKVYNFSERDYDSEAMDSLNFDTKCSLNVMRRREPLGASGNKPEKPRSPCFREPVPIVTELVNAGTEEVIIPNENGPLGIHVVPCDDDGRLVVQGIEPGGRIDRQGHLAVGDEIISINGVSLSASSFARAQEIFKEALSAKELRLGIVKGVNVSVGEREEMAVEGGDDKENKGDAANHLKSSKNRYFDASTSTTGTLTKMAAGTKITTAVNANNTRKIGKVMKIALQKGPLGLGFSITTRDNAPGGNTPIYIKNILPKGAAIEEGTLKPGDRLLEVNGTSVDGMSQSEVVTLLRNAPLDSSVNLVVSRHCVTPAVASPSKGDAGDDVFEQKSGGKKLQFQDQVHDAAGNEGHFRSEAQREEENQLKLNEYLGPPPPVPMSTSPVVVSSSEEPMDEFQFPWKQREILTFDIPVHDSERAGLGVSVKGKTSTSKDGTVVDLGIFVKSVLHGGAASRDGRLKTNDQLVNINGISLLGKHNPSAMETLRKAMHEEGPVPGIISLTVARRRYEDLDMFQGTSSSSSAATSLNSNNTNSGSFQQPTQQQQQQQQQQQHQPVHHERRDSLSSLITSSSDDMIREYNVQQPQQQHRQQHNPYQPILFPPPSFKMPGPPPIPPQPSSSSLVTSSLKHVRNPVVDRLMGKESQSAGLVPSNLRNDSYYMATHQETFNNGGGGSSMQQQQQHHHYQHYHHHQQQQQQQQKMQQQRTSSGHLGATSTMHPSDSGDGVIMIEQDDFMKMLRRDVVEEVNDEVDDDNRTTTTHESLTSLVEDFPGFARDQPGRQSMSEKRHATLDAKSTDTYQKRKKAREEKEREKEKNKVLWKKSASLESLQLVGSKSRMGPEEREAIRNAYVRANSVRVSRNRGCNESFRAAVDRSYEKDFPEDGNNDFAIEDLDPEDDDCFGNPDPGHLDKEPEVIMRRSKSERDTPSKKKNRNSKLFRGLGTMFRIGAKPTDPTGGARRSKSSSSTNRKSLSGTDMMTLSNPAPEITSTDENLRPNHGNSISATQLDYRQNFILSKSRSGDLANMPSRQSPHQQPHQKRQAPPPPPFLPHQLRAPGPSHAHAHQQQRKPGEMYAYEYFPSAMMRPGSRVGIADPAQLSTESADYDVIQRLQHRPSQSSNNDLPMRYNPGYEQLYGSHRSYQHQHHHQQQQQQHSQQMVQHHGVHLGHHGIAQVHMRSGSNLSSGSSTQNNLNTSGGSSGSGKAPRPKSNFYEYELFHPSMHQQQQQQHNHYYPPQQPHQHHHMYSVPRGANLFHPNT